jgi:hypothetical protein
MTAPGTEQHVFVPELPDLIDACEYADHPDGRLVRVRVTVTADGVRILGDGLRPACVESLLRAICDAPMEQTLCG